MSEPLTAGGSRLDLTSLASGSRQHAYVPTGAPDHEWVYKVPATAGVAEHYGLDLGGYRPVGAFTSGLYHAFVRIPNERYLARAAALRRYGATEARLQAVTRRHETLCEVRARFLGAPYRWSRRRHFARMLTLSERLAAEGFDDLMLRFSVARDCPATLRSTHGVQSYRGPIVAQQRAHFFDRSEGFDTFDWDDVIDTQQRLWRSGVGLSDANEILGPKNWALVAGRLRLADLSSLTRSARQVRRLVADDILDERQARVLRRLRQEGTREAVELATAYFAYIRAAINPRRFDQLWRTGRALGTA